MGQKVYVLTREQVAEICPSCAPKMAERGLAAIKVFVDDSGEVRFGDGSEVHIYAGFSQGMCDKFGSGEGFFTRCAETMSGKVDDAKAFCASLHKHCVGKWPGEKKHAEFPMMSRGDLMAKCKKEHPDWTDEQHKAWVEKEMKTVETYAQHANAIRGVEIFSPGKHNGDDYSEKDIDSMVEAFKDLDFRPALKVGHTKDAPGAPAYGWVTNLRKAGGKLVADFESMHDSVVQAIKDGRYGRVSSEIYFNLKRGGKLFPRALKAVALLGAEVPAVAGLKPLHKMEFATEGFESLALCEQSLEVEQRALIDSLTTRVAALSQILTESKEQDAMKIKELKEQKTALEAQLAELGKKGDKSTDEDKAKIVKFGQDIAALGKKIDEEIESLAAEAEAGKALKGQVAALMAKERTREVSDHIGRCVVKSFHADLQALYGHAVANGEVRVKRFSVDKDGKRVESEKSLVEALDSLVAQINDGAKKLFTVVAGSPNERRPEGPSDDDAGVEVDAKAKARVRDGKSKSYDEALDAVLAEDKDLAKRYHEQSAYGRASA